MNQLSAMPKANQNTPQPKPWYKELWGCLVFLVIILAIIVYAYVSDAMEKKARANRPAPRSYEEIFTPEEAERMGIGGRIDGFDERKIDPEKAARNVREFIKNGGNADPAGDAIQEGDYHDLLDQNGGPEGF